MRKTFTVLFVLLTSLSFVQGQGYDVESAKADSIEDYDGNKYSVVAIGEQQWMGENLRVTHYRNGDPIANGAGIDIASGERGYYLFYDNEPAYASDYGLLYTIDVIKEERRVCPDGWRLPSHAQWKVLDMQLGMTWKEANNWGVWNGSDEGGQLKATGTDYWELPNKGATDEKGFSMHGAGSWNEGFSGLRETASFWTSTLLDHRYKIREYNFNRAKTYHRSSFRGGRSIRCIRNHSDQSPPTIQTGGVSDVQPTSAEVTGEVTGANNATVVARGIVYGIRSEPVVERQMDFFFTSDGEGTGSFTGELSDLRPNTNYYARAYAVNASGISYGQEVSFQTSPGDVPQVGDVMQEEKSKTGLSVAASILDEGGSSVSSCGFVWSKTDAPTLKDHVAEVGYDSQIRAQIEDLDPNTYYYVRAYAVNEAGVAYSSYSAVMQTRPVKKRPEVSGPVVDNITKTTAAVEVESVKNHGYEILDKGIEYRWQGKTKTISAGQASEAFTIELSDLLPNQEFHVRAYAVSENGKAYSPSVAFSTSFSTADQALSFLQKQIYDKMYAYERGGHDDFGIKAFDLTNDLMGEDMAIATQGYGWFTPHYGYNEHKLDDSQWKASIWDRYYKRIKRANRLLADIGQVAGDAEAKEKIRGQALAIRAFTHFHLVQVFSHAYAHDPGAPGIPYLTNETKGSFPETLYNRELKEGDACAAEPRKVRGLLQSSRDGLNLPDNRKGTSDIMKRGTVEDVYTHLANDLDQAIALLEGHGEQSDPSRIDAAVAHGLRARVALAAEDWQLAITHAEQAVTISEAQGKELYSPSQYTASAFNSVQASEWMWGSDIGSEDNTAYASFYSHMDARFMSYAYLGLQKLITQELYNSFPASDVRKDLFIAPGQGSRYQPDYCQMKFLTPNSGSFAGDYLYMRLSEMYLIWAEALAHAGDDGSAQQVLYELISQRDPLYTQSSQTGSALLDEILMHRRMELWGEGHRVLDIRRLQQDLSRPLDDNHKTALAQVFNVPANDDQFLWTIPYHSLLDITVEAGGSVQADGEAYNPPLLIADNGQVMLQATADQGYVFQNWRRDSMIISNQTQYSHEMGTEDDSLKACFAAADAALYQLNLEAGPAQGGTAMGSGKLTAGEQVKVVALPAKGYHFVEWTDGAGNQISTDTAMVYAMPAEDTTLVAHFEMDPGKNPLALEATPSAGGEIYGSGVYKTNEPISVSAIPAPGYDFVKWTHKQGAEVETNKGFVYQMPAEADTLVAHFTEEPDTSMLVVKANPQEGGNVAGAGEYVENRQVTLTATPATGYEFVNWTGPDGNQVHTDSLFTYTMPAEDDTLTAHFALKTYRVTFDVDNQQGEQITSAVVTFAGQTKPAGEYVFEDIAPGQYDFAIAVDEYAGVSGTLQVVDQDITAHFTLEKTATGIAGTSNVQLSIYPVPASDQFNVESDQPIQRIQLIDIRGRMLKDVQADASLTRLDVSGLAPGVYFLKVHTADRVINREVQIGR